jgi:hypothetical protein
MSIVIGTGTPLIPLTREAFGEDGSAVLFGGVCELMMDEFTRIGPGLYGGNIQGRRGFRGACYHPELIRFREEMRGLHWYSVSLEGDEVVARMCESCSGKIVEHGPEFRAPVMEFGEISFDLVLQMTKMWVEQIHDDDPISPHCDYQYGEYCTGSRMSTLERRRTALARVDNDELTFVCSHCAHLLEKGQLNFAAKVLIDAERLPPFASLGYGRCYQHEGGVPLEALVSLLDLIEIQEHTCFGCNTKGLEWVDAVVARPPGVMRDQAICGDCYDKMVAAESRCELEGTAFHNEFVETTAIDGRQVKPDVPVPYYNEIPRRVR